jgi:hypothetical protein
MVVNNNDASKANNDDLEWRFVKKIVESDGTMTITSSNLGESFDIFNYDYKVVFSGETTNEDNDTPFIRLNNVSSSSYQALFTRSLGSSTLTFSLDNSSNISTGALLSGGSDFVGLTVVNLEFIITRSYIGFDAFGNTNFALSVFGDGFSGGAKAPSGTPIIIPTFSKFLGNLGGTIAQTLTQIDIVHNITSGSIDNSVGRIYKRKKQ